MPPGSGRRNIGFEGARKAVPGVYFCTVNFPLVIAVAGKGCVIFREAALMQMISGKREPAIIHYNPRQNESISALTGRKEVELAGGEAEREEQGEKGVGLGRMSRGPKTA